MSFSKVLLPLLFIASLCSFGFVEEDPCDPGTPVYPSVPDCPEGSSRDASQEALCKQLFEIGWYGAHNIACIKIQEAENAFDDAVMAAETIRDASLALADEILDRQEKKYDDDYANGLMTTEEWTAAIVASYAFHQELVNAANGTFDQAVETARIQFGWAKASAELGLVSALATDRSEYLSCMMNACVEDNE